jgi:hypothetical protein
LGNIGNDDLWFAAKLGNALGHIVETVRPAGYQHNTGAAAGSFVGKFNTKTGRCAGYNDNGGRGYVHDDE